MPIGVPAYTPAPVLAVQQLAADGDRGIGVLDDDLEPQHGEVPLLEAHDALVTHAHTLARRGLQTT